jgi:proline racemase
MTPADPPHVLRTIDAHVAGAPVRLVVDGWPPMTGRTLKERFMRLQRRCDHLRIALMHEPRGHAAMCGALLLEPSDPSAHAGLGFMHHAGWSGYCGHALIGAAAMALQRGLVHRAPGTPLRIETAAGVADVEVDGARVRTSVPSSSLVAPGLALELGSRAISVDLAWCAGLYAFTDAEIAGAPLDLSRSAALAARANDVRAALARTVFPALPEGLRQIEGITFVAADERGEADLRSATVYEDGAVDRSPGGGATAALVCVLDAMGMLPEGRPLLHAGPGGAFAARILDRAEQPGVDHPVLRIELEADVYVTGEHTFLLDPADPSVPRPPAARRARRSPAR